MINFAVRSETGFVRKNNEDNFYANGIFMSEQERDNPFFITGSADAPCIFAVCDGMGGEECGELASLMTVKTLDEHAEKIRIGFYKEVDDFAQNANRNLLSLPVRSATTLALVVIKESNKFMAYNLGNSRIYRFENDRLLRITNDHTVAEDKVRMGLLTPKKAEQSSERHILTAYVGNRDYTSPDFYGPYNSSKIILCSDGLTDMLSYQEISTIVKNSESASETVNKLVDEALSKGGHDNVTCVVITF